MKWLGVEKRKLTSLAYDRADIEARMGTERVRQLAASYVESTGGEPGNMPWVRSLDSMLVAGRDRVAAALVNHLDELDVRIGEFTLEEAIKAKAHEGLRRLDNWTDLLAQMSREMELAIGSKRAARPEKAPRKPGRPQTAKGEARAEVAKVAGTTPEAVRRAETRAAARAEPPKDVPPAPPIHTFGLPLPDKLRADVEHVLEHAGAAAQALQRALGALTQASEALDALNAAENYAASLPWCKDVKRLHDQVRTLGADVRAYLPKSLCAYCKGDGHVPVGGLQRCTVCRGAGWVGADASKAPIPAELLREGAAAMVSNGAGGSVPFAKVQPKGAAPVSSRGPKAEKPPKGADRLEPAPAPSAAAGSDAPTSPAVVTIEEVIGRAPVAGSKFTPGQKVHFASKPPKPRTMLVEVGGRMVDALNPPDDLTYSGDDAPPADLPELVVEPDEAVAIDDDELAF